MMTNEQIQQHLAAIEEEYQVQILFAAESGSRAWGFHSPDSDWDVRFIYVHPLEWYLQVMPDRDVIEVMSEDGFDASGWDIRKALQLFRKTNLTLLEWLGSPIIYKDNDSLRKALQALQPMFFNKTRALYHYYHVATKQQNRYLEKRGVELKRYLYFLRALLACRWIAEQSAPPPVLFMELVESQVTDPEVKEAIMHIVQLKQSSCEHNKEIVPPLLWVYGQQLEEEVRRLLTEQHSTKELPKDADKALDKLLYQLTTNNKLL